MYANLLENRNRAVSELIKLGTCIGRSLRENVKIFSVDSETKLVTYLTESEYLIEGNYNLEDKPTLKNIVISSTDVMKDTKLYEKHVNSQIGDFIGSILHDNHAEANLSFDKVLGLWENRLRLTEEEEQLKKESARNKKNSSIVETAEFYKMVEISPTIVEFLKENRESIEKNGNILDALAMSSVISEAFDIPRLTLESLGELEEYSLKDEKTSSVFDLVCKQELLKQEIYESKREFEKMWVNNPRIQKIVSNIFEQDEEEVVTSIIEAVTEIPYFALATKKQLNSLLSNSLAMNEGIVVSNEELRNYASSLFEINKPIKEGIIEALNEKYGIDVRNLKDLPSFGVIVENQRFLFSEIAEMAPEKSNIRVVCNEIVSMLDKKNGVESIDMNDFSHSLFEEAGYQDIILEKKITKHVDVDFKKIVKDLGNLEDTFKTIKKNVGSQYDSNEGQPESKGNGSSTAVAKSPKKTKAKDEKGKEDEDPRSEEEIAQAAAPEVGVEPDPAAEDEVETATPPQDTKDLNKKLQSMDDLISDLASAFGAGDLGGGHADDGTDDEGSANK